MFKVPPCLFMARYLLSFHYSIIFHRLDVSLFIHLPSEGHLGCSRSLAIVNKAAINIMCRFLCIYKFSTVLGKYQGVWLLNHIKSMFSFVRNFQTVFQSICTILYSHQQGMRVLVAPYPHWCCPCSGYWSFW